ncbi:MAG: BRCT domain-containing protein, partial [Planctomycetota bacterium]
MPARRRKQSNAMLYTLITFVALFIAATTIAVIYYVKAEEYRTGEADLQREMDELATDRERSTLSGTVGERQARTSYIGSMIAYVDQALTLIVGGIPAPDSAEAKVKKANAEVADALNVAANHIDVGDPNTIGLVQAIKALAADLDNAKKAKLDTEKLLAEQQERFKKADEANVEKEKTLAAERDKIQQAFEDEQQRYADLAASLQQTTDERVQTLTNERDQAREDLKTLNGMLLKTQALLKTAEDRIKQAQDAVAKFEPGPDSAVLAHKSDAEVILVDGKAQVVHLNIGSNDRVYPGLTFTVYDRGGSIPKDGKGKAEIQVFDVSETYSAARILEPDVDNPILEGDFAANLIWDADRTNVFVVAGDFDLDGDGELDADGIDKIKRLVTKWGGEMADSVSVDTDFVVLGEQPTVIQRPSIEEEEIDPRAMARHEASLARLSRYNQ